MTNIAAALDNLFIRNNGTFIRYIKSSENAPDESFIGSFLFYLNLYIHNGRK